MWNLKNKINNNNKNGNKLIDIENILRVTRWEGTWGVGEKGQRYQEVQMGSYKIVMKI